MLAVAQAIGSARHAPRGRRRRRALASCPRHEPASARHCTPPRVRLTPDRCDRATPRLAPPSRLCPAHRTRHCAPPARARSQAPQPHSPTRFSLSPPPPSLVLAWQVSGAKGKIQAGPLGKLASQVEALDRKVEETKGKISGRVADAKGKAGEATGKLASPFDNLARQIEETKERLKGGS